MKQQSAVSCRTIFTKRVRRETAVPSAGLLPALVMQVGRVKRLLFGVLPQTGRSRCVLVKGSAADADAAFLQLTHPQNPFLRADAAQRLLQLLEGDSEAACAKSGLSRQQLGRLLQLSQFSPHERELAAACGLPQQALLRLAGYDEVQRRRLLVAAAKRKKQCSEAAKRLSGATLRIQGGRSVKDERIVKNTLQHATDQICRAGFHAALESRSVAGGTAYRVLVKSPAAQNEAALAASE